MAKKSRSAKKLKKPIKKRVLHKKPNKNGSNFIRIPGTARRYLNKKTGKSISRREYEKLFPPQPIIKILGKEKAAERIRKNRESQARYQRLVQDYIRKINREGLETTKRGVRNSTHFKTIVRRLRSKNPDLKAQALFESGRITKEEIALYIEKFDKEAEGIKIRRRWQCVSIRTGAVAYEGSYRECMRWISQGSRRLRFKMEPVDYHEDEGEEDE